METNSGIGVLEALVTNTDMAAGLQYQDGTTVGSDNPNTLAVPFDHNNATIAIRRWW